MSTSGLLLTPGDAFDLRNYLQKQGFAKRPLETLQLSLDTPAIRSCSFHTTLATNNDPSTASSVTDIVLSLLEGKKPSAALLALADKLALQLIRPEAFLAVPQYWFCGVARNGRRSGSAIFDGPELLY